MMVVQFNTFGGLTVEQAQALNAFVDPPYEIEGDKVKDYYGTRSGDLERVLKVLPNVQVQGTGGAPLLEMANAIRELQRKLEDLERPNYNEKVGVFMPGSPLFEVDELMLCEDPCTDALQDELNDGWRILAICPQPDQRRPDYILGRVKAVGASKPDGAQRGGEGR